jgi:hypothetical protein
MTKPSSIPERDEGVADFRLELKAHRKALEALRQTQVEQGKKMDEGFKEMRNGFGTIHVGMAQIMSVEQDRRRAGDGRRVDDDAGQ